MDKTKLALAVACLTLAGIVAWQQLSFQQAVAPPAPLQLRPPAAPSVSAAAAPEPANSAPAVVSAKPESAPAKKPAARREPVKPAAPPVATTASRGTAVSPLAAPAAADKPAPADEEAQAAVRLKQGEYREAGELFESAVRNGGKATFVLIHDHSKGNFEKDPKASCVGELVMSSTDIRFDGAGVGESHHFEASWADVLDAGANKFFGSGIGGFHVTLNEDGKYKNLNFAPKSKDKAEAKMIIDLLNASGRKGDRGK